MIKLKQILVLFLLITSYGKLFSQTPLQEKASIIISQDTTFRKGTLSNGLTYYLHNTKVVKEKASFYIIQNVGSTLENQNQQGLAHFLEHMAFNGTKNYPNKTFLNIMEKNGLVFGRDINAYTGFDETVYNINNIPTSPKMVQHGLQILYDWADALLLTEKEIDAERSVIKEEWRQRQNGQMRIFNKVADVMFGTPKYSNRFPIGQMEIIETFKYQTLKNFYKDWYRTDLQAIAIVGDIDINELEKKIKSIFSKIPKVFNPKKRIQVKVPNNQELEFAMGKDKEVSTERISFNIRHNKIVNDGSFEKLEKLLIRSFISRVLNERLKVLSQDPNTSFLKTYVSTSNSLRNYDSFSINISPKENKQYESFKLVMNELQRALKFGFTNSEIKRQTLNIKNIYKNYIKELDNRSHQKIIQIIKKDYLEGVIIGDPKQEYKAALQVFKNLTPEKIHKELLSYYTKNNRSVIITGVEGRKNLNKSDVIKIISDAENNSQLTPYKEKIIKIGLMEGITLSPGKILHKKTDKLIGYTEYALSNGIKVYYKHINKDKNKVNLNAISEGGLSILNPKDHFMADVSTSLVKLSGINKFSLVHLQKYLTGKKVNVTSSISNLYEKIQGFSSTEDIETMFQLTNLHFTNPRFEENAINLIRQNYKNYLLYKKQDLNEKKKDSLKLTIYGKHLSKAILTEKLINTIEYGKAKEIYLDRFKDPSDFKFFIVGDIGEDKLLPLIEKYIASLRTGTTTENYNKNYKIDWKSNYIKKDIFLKMKNPKSTVRIVKKKNPASFKLNDKYAVEILGDILQLRYTETLRENMGGTYGAGVDGFYIDKPIYEYGIGIGFDCNPNMVENLISIVYEELNKIANGDINTNDLNKSKKAKLKSRAEIRLRNSYDIKVIQNYILNGYNIDSNENFKDIIEKISKKDIQNIAHELLAKDTKSYEVVFKPKK